MLFAAVAACGRTETELSRSVRAYDDALVVAFQAGDIAALKQHATDTEVKKVSALVELKRAAGLVLESEILSFTVDSIEQIGPAGAIVRTSETWKYHDRALAPGKAPGETFVSRMTMEYTMERNPGGWRVAQVRTLTNEFLEPKGFRVEKRAHGTEATR